MQFLEGGAFAPNAPSWIRHWTSDDEIIMSMIYEFYVWAAAPSEKKIVTSFSQHGDRDGCPPVSTAILNESEMACYLAGGNKIYAKNSTINTWV